MQKYTLMFGLGLSIVIACKNEPVEEMRYQPMAVELEVKQALNSYYKDISKEGFAAEFDYLDSSNQFFWVPPGYNSALDFDSVATLLKANEKLFTSISFNWESLTVHPLEEDMATYYGVVSGNMMDTTGVASKMRLIESGTMIKRKSGWKLLCGQSAIIE